MAHLIIDEVAILLRCYIIASFPSLFPSLNFYVIDTKTSEQALDQQEYYNVTRDGVTMEETQVYDNPERLHNEIVMSPNVVYGAGDQKPREIKMMGNQVYGL